LALWAEAERQS
jgi:hypothetical protein